MSIPMDYDGEAMRGLFRAAYSHALPVYFGIAPARRRAGEPATLYNGSATILQLPAALIAVTCAHVIEGFREAFRKDSRVHFQLGTCPVSILDMIIAEDASLDLATIDLSALSSLGSLSERDEDIPLTALVPGTWPPAAVSRGERLIVSGFPGAGWRSEAPDGIVDAPALTIGAIACDVDNDGVVIEITRDRWLSEEFQEVPDTVRNVDLGGLSGCPVFAVRSSLEFVGVVAMSTGADVVRVRSSRFINAHGLLG